MVEKVRQITDETGNGVRAELSANKQFVIEANAERDKKIQTLSTE